MKKIFTLCLLCVVLLSLVGCTKNNEPDVNTNSKTDNFQELTDNVMDAIEDNDDLSELKTDVESIKNEILDSVSSASEEDKDQYDVKQIAVFMLEKAIEEYEAAEKDKDKTKMEDAKTNIEMARKIWSSSSSNY